MNISLIVATANNNVIGNNNTLPWHLPEDLKYFKSVTLGKPIIMGRKTFESIGKPLPGRTNIVVTRQENWQFDNVLVASSVAEAVELAKENLAAKKIPQLETKNEVLADKRFIEKEIMVIGGAEIYRHALPLATKIYLTRLALDVAGDAYFSELPVEEWELTSQVQGDASAAIPHEFLIYQRKK